jgi:uncharacterized repeat protein (TIGR04076 family)
MTAPNTTTETIAGAAPATMAPATPPTIAPGTTTSATTAAPAGPGFELYDLRVEVVGPSDKPIYCGAKLGDFFELHGEMLKFPPGQGFSIYSLAALLPLLPAKQRVTDPNDWMTSDAEVACPDPNCPTRFRITRTGRRYFKRSDTTAVPLPTQDSR